MRIVHKATRTFTRLQAEAIGLALRNAETFRGRSQTVVANEFSTTQPRISRLYNGEFSEKTALLENLCAAAGVTLDAHNPPASPHTPSLPPVLRDALSALWDGSVESAKPVAALLLAVAECTPVKPSKE